MTCSPLFLECHVYIQDRSIPPPWAPGHQVSRLFSLRAPTPCEVSFCPSSSFVSPLTYKQPQRLIAQVCITACAPYTSCDHSAHAALRRHRFL